MKQKAMARVFAAFLAFIFSFTHVVFAYKPESHLWADRKPTVHNLINSSWPLLLSSKSNFRSPDMKKTTLPSSASPEISEVLDMLSNQNGTVREIQIPNRWNKQLVVYIQDVHSNPEAQSNIGKTIKRLVESQKLDLIAIEGAFSKIDLSFFRNFPQNHLLKQVSDYLLKTGDLQGPLHAALTTQVPVPLICGIDDPAHYQANIDAYVNSRDFILNNQFSLGKRVREVEKEKARLFSVELYAFDQLVESYRSGQTSLPDFLQTVLLKSGSRSLPLKSFLDAIALESHLDFQKVERERKELLLELIRKCDRDQMAALSRAGDDLRTERLSSADFYAFIKQLCSTLEISLGKYAAVDSYARYTALVQSINMDQITRDLNRAEEDIYANLISMEIEKKLVEESRFLYLTGKLLNFSLSSQEWGEYKKRKGKFASIAPLGPFESFYHEAELRDALMSANLIRQLQVHNISVAVLVTGGFHSAGIIGKLEAEGVATITFVPTLTKADLESPAAYLSIFNQDHGLLNQLFSGVKLFLSPDPTLGLKKIPGMLSALSSDGGNYFSGPSLRIERRLNRGAAQAVLTANGVRAVTSLSQNQDGGIESAQIEVRPLARFLFRAPPVFWKWLNVISNKFFHSFFVRLGSVLGIAPNRLSLPGNELSTVQSLSDGFRDRFASFLKSGTINREQGFTLAALGVSSVALLAGIFSREPNAAFIALIAGSLGLVGSIPAFVASHKIIDLKSKLGAVAGYFTFGFTTLFSYIYVVSGFIEFSQRMFFNNVPALVAAFIISLTPAYVASRLAGLSTHFAYNVFSPNPASSEPDEKTLQKKVFEKIFLHNDGVGFLPLVWHLHESGILDKLKSSHQNSPATFTAILDYARSAEGHVNEGYLQIGLWALATQGWLIRNEKDDGSYEFYFTEKGRTAADVVQYFKPIIDFIPDAMRMDDLLFSRGPPANGTPLPRDDLSLERFRRLVRLAKDEWNLPSQITGDLRKQVLAHLNGMLVGPVMLALKDKDVFDQKPEKAEFDVVEIQGTLTTIDEKLKKHEEILPGDPAFLQGAFQLLLQQGWVEQTDIGKFAHTPEGKFAASRAWAYGVPFSYLPLYSYVDKLYFGENPDSVFDRDAEGHEKHVNRLMNVKGSGASHKTYFVKMDEVIREMFNRPLEEQPKFIEDMGCGDGTMLIHIYEVIKKETLRGKHLDTHPLLFVGADYNERSRWITEQNLRKAGIPRFDVVFGDINDPDSLAKLLFTKHDLEMKDGLHIRSMLDHNRPFLPANQVAAHQRKGRSTGVFVGNDGKIIKNKIMEQNLFEHHKKWAQHMGPFGLLSVELHTLPPSVAASNIGKIMVTSYGTSHWLSKQYPIEASIDLDLAREAGFHIKRAEYFPTEALSMVTVRHMTVEPVSPKGRIVPFLSQKSGWGSSVASFLGLIHILYKNYLVPFLSHAARLTRVNRNIQNQILSDAGSHPLDLGVRQDARKVRVIELSQAAGIERLITPTLSWIHQSPKHFAVFALAPMEGESNESISNAIQSVLQSKKSIPLLRDQMTFVDGRSLSIEQILSEAHSGQNTSYQSGLWKTAFSPVTAGLEWIKTTQRWNGNSSGLISVGDWLQIRLDDVLQVLFEVSNTAVDLDTMIRAAVLSKQAA